ncbi:hypothetical protein GGF31_003492 [Allomyces arbusculus]|nr:hypothetical protein GGF31_003492 [Allomyces arbusculus]
MTNPANKTTADTSNPASEEQVVLYKPSELAIIAHNEAMVHMSRSPWEKRVGSAPMAIAAIGLLRCLVVGNDFSIKDSTPIGGWQFVKRPESFCATMSLLSHETVSAFNLAQSNMNRINFASKNVHDNIEVLFTILSEGDMEMVREMLPGALDPISVDADQCRKLADAVTAQFGKIKAFTQEVEQACLAEQSVSATKLTQAKNETAINETTAEQNTKKLDLKMKQVTETGEMAKDAQEYYRHVNDSEPTGWNSLAKAAVGVGVKVSTHVLTEAVSVMSGTARQAFRFLRPASAEEDEEEEDDDDDEGRSFGTDDEKDKGAMLPTSVVDDVSAAIELLQGLKLSRVDEAVAVADGSSAPPVSSGSAYDQSLFDNTISKVNAPLKRAKTQLQSYKEVGTVQDEKKIIDKALELAQRAQDLNRELNQLPDKLKAFYDEATQLGEEQSRVVDFVAKRKKAAKKNRNKSSGKGMTKSVEGILSMAIDKEYEAWEDRVRRSREEYKELRAEYKEQLKELEEMQERNAQLLKSIVQGKSEVTNLEEIVKLLKAGVQALGRLQVHWEKLSLYFRDIADVVDACNTKVAALAKQAGVMANKRLTSGDPLPVAYQKLLYGYCVRADALSRVVGAVSTMYVGVSNEHLQPLLLRLGEVNTLEKKMEIEDFKQKMELDAQKAQDIIVEKLTKSKEEYISSALRSKNANALIYKGHY